MAVQIAFFCSWNHRTEKGRTILSRTRLKQYTYSPFSWNTTPWSSNCLFFTDKIHDKSEICMTFSTTCKEIARSKNWPPRMQIFPSTQNFLQWSAACSCFNLMEDNKYTVVLTAFFTAYLQLLCNGTPLTLYAAVFSTFCAATRLILELLGIFLHFPRTFILRLLKSYCC
jgi:hypothetical protein